jgi:2-phosphosulfolactate phosphatase
MKGVFAVWVKQLRSASMPAPSPPSSPATQTVNVHLLPELADARALAGEVLVVIDVLRASTTLAAALAAGVRTVVPCLEVNEARQLAGQRRAHGSVLLGGERGGLPIAGFDLGNSPGEYTADRVAGQTLVFTSTNGTRAMMRCVGAARVLVACFANLSAVARALAAETRVELLCAGTEGQVSYEDTLLAGGLVDRLGGTRLRLNDGALLALQCWRQIGGEDVSHAQLCDALQQGRGGQNLRAIGRGDDIAWAASIDRLEVVPELDLAAWVVRKWDDSP